MRLNANLPAAYFGVPTAQVVEVGLGMWMSRAIARVFCEFSAALRVVR
jgi:hypothetical protein